MTARACRLPSRNVLVVSYYRSQSPCCALEILELESEVALGTRPEEVYLKLSNT